MLSRLRARFRRPLLHQGHIPGLRTAKSTLAAVLAYVVSSLLHTSDQPVIAALTALLVVQLTMYETVAQGLQRIASVVAGVLVALGIATFVGLTWWSLGAVVAISLVIGLVLRLGPHMIEVPISAMLVLAVGGSEGAAAGRVFETLIGAGIGVLVNLVIAPPLYVRPAGDAIGVLAVRMAGLLTGLAAALRTGWSRSAADHWLGQARNLAYEVEHAGHSLEQAERSARLNPRAGPVREAQPRLRIAFTALEHCYVSVRVLCRALFDRMYYVPTEEQEHAYDQREREALADVLDRAAEALAAVVPVAVGTGPADDARARVERHLDDLHDGRDRLAELLLVDPVADQGAWQQHGELLAAVDRLRVEIEAAVRPPDRPWRPPLVGERQREALRKVRDAAARAAEEMQPFWPDQRPENRGPRPEPPLPPPQS